jgi:hypothetical protein
LSSFGLMMIAAAAEVKRTTIHPMNLRPQYGESAQGDRHVFRPPAVSGIQYETGRNMSQSPGL